MNHTSEHKKVSNLVSRRSAIVWSLHWVSALLAVYITVTSIGSGLGVSKRVFPVIWMNWHLSAGIALLAVTIVRLYTSHPWKSLMGMLTFKPLDEMAMRSILIVVIFFSAATGLLIYQSLPFGPVGYIFGLTPMPTLVRLRHSYHNLIIDLHIFLAAATAFFIVLHGYRDRSRIIQMLWPWRRPK